MGVWQFPTGKNHAAPVFAARYLAASGNARAEPGKPSSSTSTSQV
jgi:hypothetical protein